MNNKMFHLARLAVIGFNAAGALLATYLYTTKGLQNIAVWSLASATGWIVAFYFANLNFNSKVNEPS